MKIIQSIVLLSAISFAGCNKIIDLTPQSNINSGTYYSNASEISTALTGCYNGIQKSLADEWSLTELRSDNVVQGVRASTSTVNRDLSDLDMFFPSTSHQGIYNYWLNTYYNIRNVNFVLNSLGVDYSETAGTLSYNPITIPVTTADVKSLAAEASFIRAYHYFNLVRLYGGVFLVHEPISPEEAKGLNRTTTADIYKLIIADLQNAATNGSAAKFASIVPANLGRANSWSAKALLAKVYLTINRKADAIPLLQDVIANSGYALQSSYASVFSITNEMNSEVLFAVRYKAGGIGLGSPFPNSFAPLNSGAAIANGDGRGYMYPAAELNSSYFSIAIPSASVKKDSTRVVLAAANAAILPGMSVTGTQIAVGTTVTAINGTVLTLSLPATATLTTAALAISDPRKAISIGTFTGGVLYPAKLISNPPIVNDGENDWMVIRYADVLLMLAEAQGNSAASIALINQTRTRAKLAPLDPLVVNTVALFEAELAKERRVELAFEDQRFFDLQRMNTNFTTLTMEQTIKDHFAVMYPLHYFGYPAPVLTLAQMQAFVISNRMLLPIPQREIDNNTRIVIPQNPGY
ncbi:MAG: RagB/SusD family nutrient uptake outer membrane protein [Bacteroidota bacterium]